MNFTTSDGLTDSSVNCILQGQDGDLWFGTGSWFGTGKGVTRYDGRTWSTFSPKDGLAHGGVVSIVEDREGYLWFATERGGVSRYRHQEFTTFTIEDGLSNNEVWSIFQDVDESLWFGTGEAISRYDGNTFTTHTIPVNTGSAVRSICKDRDGNFWFAISGGGLVCYNGKTYTQFTAEDGIGGMAGHFALQDDDGDIWYASWGGWRYPV